IAANGSANVTVHVVVPDPAASGSGMITVKVDEDQVGDANSSNDSMSIAVSTADWKLVVNGSGASDSNAFVVGGGGSNTATVQPTIIGSGDFFTPVTVLNGIVSSRITATPSLTSFTSQQQQIQYTISAASNAAACPVGAAPVACYAAQVIARFVDGGHNTAQRQATI